MPGSDWDWDAEDWEVDSKAKSLHKALFGKTSKVKASSIKADADLDDVSGVCADSDDDDAGKLSRKAKKKLKERKRKENKRNKLENGNTETSTEPETSVEDVDGKKLKSKSSETKKSPKKKKDKAENNGGQDPDETKVEKPKRKRNRKRKTPATDDGKDGTNEDDKEGKKLKKSEVENKTDKEEGEEEKPKKKRKRVKKKNTNRNKNKYAHLGRKGDVSVGAESDDEGESLSSKKPGKGSDKSNSASSESGVKSKNSRKRQRSASPEATAKNKKTKLVNGDVQEDNSLNVKKNENKKMKSKNTEDDANEIEKMDIDDGSNNKKTKKLKKKKAAATNDVENTVKNTATKSNGNDKNKTDQVKETGDKKKKSNKRNKENKDDTETDSVSKSTISPFVTSTQGSELQQKVTDKLASARFRFINEQLYTIKGGEAFRMFKQDGTLMEAYHTGFKSQVQQWSVNPLDVIIKQISTKASNLVIADFGCGEAKLSASVKQKVHSFDLYAINKKVTVCDMAKTPLSSGAVDIAVFCLSLMGTNLNDYLVEANRVLKEGGLLKIAEVVSRFSDANKFIKAVSAFGFKPVNSRELSAMFYLMDFKKVKTVEKTSKHAAPISLKPCVYKKR